MAISDAVLGWQVPQSLSACRGRSQPYRARDCQARLAGAADHEQARSSEAVVAVGVTVHELITISVERNLELRAEGGMAEQRDWHGRERLMAAIANGLEDRGEYTDRAIRVRGSETEPVGGTIRVRQPPRLAVVVCVAGSFRLGPANRSARSALSRLVVLAEDFHRS